MTTRKKAPTSARGTTPGRAVLRTDLPRPGECDDDKVVNLFLSLPSVAVRELTPAIALPYAWGVELLALSDLEDGRGREGDAKKLSIICSENRYTDSPSVILIESFLIAIRLGVYPPPDILREIGRRLGLWFDQQSPTLDSAFEVVKSGRRGRGTPLSSLNLARRNAALFDEMNMLMAWGATREEAARMASAMCPKPAISASTLQDSHKKYAIRMRKFEGPNWFKIRTREFRAYSDEEKIGIVSRYPKSSVIGELLKWCKSTK